MAKDCVKLRKILEHIKDLKAAQDDMWERQQNPFRLPGFALWDQSDWLRAYVGEVPVRNAVIQPEGLIATIKGQPAKCGTAGCFAGWDALLFAPAGTVLNGNLMTLPDGGEATTIAEWAIEDLGLEPFEASELFDHRNKIPDLETYIGLWCGEEG